MTISMAKFTLSLEEDYPYFIIGISSSTPDYRLCWSLNKTLDISLKREESIDIHSKKGDIAAHNVFEFTNEEFNTKYRLIENKKGSSRFLSEAHQADYLLIIDESERIELSELLNEIKKIAQVILAFSIDIDSLKHKQNLMLTA